MKLLFDENLSPRLAAAFQNEYPGSTRVHLAGQSSAPGDEARRGDVSRGKIEAALREYREAIARLDAEAGLAVLVV